MNGRSCHVLRGGKIVAEAVAVSSRSNVDRKRFTPVHELAHRIIRSTGNPAIDLERAMNRFAGAFPVPGQCLREEVGADRHRITCFETVRPQHGYGVSAAALLTRIGQVDALPQGSVWKPIVPSRKEETTAVLTATGGRHYRRRTRR